MSDKKTKTKKEKEEGQRHEKKSDLDDTYIGPTDPLHDEDPRSRRPRRE